MPKAKYDLRYLPLFYEELDRDVSHIAISVIFSNISRYKSDFITPILSFLLHFLIYKFDAIFKIIFSMSNGFISPVLI